MVIAIALAVPIPIAVSIGTVIGYFMLDLDFAGIANSMYTGVEPFPSYNSSFICFCWFIDGAGWNGKANC